ncbi:MAG: 2,3-bisphosphoglycerate-independent phosphoglycerate mutase [Desulfonauticus sp.]|nr:2,3-bisphosphoglycerate-independent phosphoglycerate mutase [Desulfonauticus sp.]
MQVKPTLLLILDGYGLAQPGPGNAIALASTPNLDKLFSRYPHTTLKACGKSVGLPEGQMGNSEVGHLNLGAGRIVDQDIVRINKAIEDGSLCENPVLNALIARTKNTTGRIHLLGLLSDGGVHSLQTHVYALVKCLKSKGIHSVYIHCFLDGRDTPPQSAQKYVKELKDFLEQEQIGQIASLSGRYYAMDRDKHWERTQLAYDCLVSGKGRKANCPLQAIDTAYKQGETDEFIKPTVIEGVDGTLQDGDGILFFNFRADRIRQICQSLFDPNFKEFEREKFPNLYIVTMTEYEHNFSLPVLFPPLVLKNILGEVVSHLGLKQLRIAETEKYAHVTYFFNGGQETPFEGEDRILVPSPREVATYDQKPEMSVFEVADKLKQAIKTKQYDLYICNFANLDMVGHTGIIPAVIKACEAVDSCVGKVVEAMLSIGGQVILTADHGNAEDMLDGQKPKTSHSTNPVPFILISENMCPKLKPGKLGDVAPTILHLWDIDKPKEMTGLSLLE